MTAIAIPKTKFTFVVVVVVVVVYRYLSLWAFTAFLYTLSVIAIASFYWYFVRVSSCQMNLFFITFNLCFCVAASFISVLPKVQQAQAGTGGCHQFVMIFSVEKPLLANGQSELGHFVFVS